MLARIALSLALLASPALADGITKSVITSGGVTITHGDGKPLHQQTCPGNVCPGDIEIVFPVCSKTFDKKTGRPTCAPLPPQGTGGCYWTRDANGNDTAKCFNN